MKVVGNPAKFMHESGLLYEVNRLVMHPLGLALYYAENDAGEIEVQGLGVLQTEDDDPIDGYEPDRAAAARERLHAYLVGRGLRPRTETCCANATFLHEKWLHCDTHPNWRPK